LALYISRPKSTVNQARRARARVPPYVPVHFDSFTTLQSKHAHTLSNNTMLESICGACDDDKAQQQQVADALVDASGAKEVALECDYERQCTTLYKQIEKQ
jgi:hypothetical protein